LEKSRSEESWGLKNREKNYKKKKGALSLQRTNRSDVHWNSMSVLQRDVMTLGGGKLHPKTALFTIRQKVFPFTRLEGVGGKVGG